MTSQRKIAINVSFWGFCLSEMASNRYYEKSGKAFHKFETKRDDPILIEVIEELGAEKASGNHATLAIVSIPSDIEWDIEDFGGNENIAEKHRKWFAHCSEADNIS